MKPKSACIIILFSLIICNTLFAQKKGESAKPDNTYSTSSSSFQKIGDYDYPENLSISPDNKQLAFSYGGHNGNFVVLDLNSNQELKNKNYKGYITSVKYAPSGKYLLFTSEGILYLKNSSNTNEFTKNYERYYISDFAFSPDEGFIVLILNNKAPFGDAFIVLYDIKNDKDIYSIRFDTGLSKVIITNSGKYIITYGGGSSYNSAIYILDIRTGSMVNSFLTGYQFISENIDITSNDSTLITSSRQNDILKIWNTFTGEFKKSLRTQEYNSDFAITPDDRYIISYFSDNEKNYLYLFDLEKNVNFESYELEWGGTSIALSNDYKYIVFGIGPLGLYKKDISWMNRSKLYNKSYKKMIDKLKQEYRNHKERDEFETIDQYFDRAELFNQKIIDIKKDFINTMIDDENSWITDAEKKNKEVTDKIANSIKDTLLSISKVGYYNIDQQLLPITISNITNNISISTEDAKSLKENYKTTVVRAKKKLKYNLKDWEVFEIIIVHPISYKEYIFN